MDEKTQHKRKLKIDPYFKSLIRPLSQQEFIQLEENILADGCRDPIVIWNDVIIDGHNRYEICTKHHIPFSYIEMDFSCREEAVAWICSNQLGRRNLTDETKKYLIGLQYDNKKIANNKKNMQGKNQYAEVPVPVKHESSYRNRTAQAIADEHNISHSTVEKYAIYSRAIKEIKKKSPELGAKILSGDYKVSHANTLELAKFPKEAVQRIERRLDHNEPNTIRFKSSRNEIRSNMQKEAGTNTNHMEKEPSIKDMPAYDPDAELTGLILTIPSWRSSISRVRDKTNISVASTKAKKNLCFELLNLNLCIESMLNTIRETIDD